MPFYPVRDISRPATESAASTNSRRGGHRQDPDARRPRHRAASAASHSADRGTRERVWGSPWRSQVPFPGLAYCLGGRSLYWGGWSPRLTAADLANWPLEIATCLQSAAPNDGYEQVEKETGVWD